MEEVLDGKFKNEDFKENSTIYCFFLNLAERTKHHKEHNINALFAGLNYLNKRGREDIVKNLFTLLKFTEEN